MCRAEQSRRALQNRFGRETKLRHSGIYRLIFGVAAWKVSPFGIMGATWWLPLYLVLTEGVRGRVAPMMPSGQAFRKRFQFLACKFHYGGAWLNTLPNWLSVPSVFKLKFAPVIRKASPFGIMGATRCPPPEPIIYGPNWGSSGEPSSGSHDAERPSLSGSYPKC